MRDYTFWTELAIRRRVIFLQIAALVLAFVVLGTLVWPPVYQSTAEILVQDNRAQFLASPDIQDNNPNRPAVVINPISEEDLNSERELMTSEFLIKQAIAGVPEQPDNSVAALMLKGVSGALSLPSLGYDVLHSVPAVSAKDDWAIRIAKHLDSTVIKRSNVIELSFTSHDQRWTKDFLSRLINQYIAFHAQISHDPQSEKFFNEQAEVLEARLHASEDKLRQFRLQSGITDLDGQTKALIDRISQLNLERDRDAAATASARQQAAFLEEILQKTPERISKETRSVQNEALSQLKPQVMQMKSERAELLARYQPNSARIREIDSKLAAAQKILDQEDRLEVQEASTDLNPIWVSIRTDIAQAKGQAASSDAARASLEGEISHGREQLDQLVNGGVELQPLQRQVDNDQQAYMAYMRKAEEARAAHGMNTSKILNVSVAQEATLPVAPKFPIVWLNLMVGFLLALGAGLAAAYWEEAHDPKIYSNVAIAEASGLTTVAIIRDEA